jgi:hypothetical protein
MLASWVVRAQVGERKLRLFACACCRCIWHLLTDARSRRAVEVAELCADGSEWLLERAAAAADARAARNAAFVAWRERGSGAGTVLIEPLQAALASIEDVLAGDAWARGAGGLKAARSVRDSCWLIAEEPAAGVSSRRALMTDLAVLLRELLGNPFRTAPAVDPAWRDGAVRKLAEAAYEERRLPEGTLEPVRLPLLADALEDAGCTDAELLGHLRSPGPHVRGCWAVDLVLGKS